MAANDLLVNSQREIDTNLIDDDDSPKDRLAVDDESIAGLAEQIRAHGQLVPILVRQNHERPGRFRIVYGRRRLAALKRLGRPAKVLIHNLTDEQAIVAQGLENSARKDPSFIEKALFAKQLRERGYETTIIRDALSIDDAMASRMKFVSERIPIELVAAIGAAPSIGRRRWEEVARALESISGEDVAGQALSTCFPEPPLEGSTSDERFELALANLEAHAARKAQEASSPPARPRTSNPLEWRLPDGRALARIRSSKTSLTLDVSRKENPEFTAWFEAEGETILARAYEAWTKSNGSQ